MEWNYTPRDVLMELQLLPLYGGNFFRKAATVETSSECLCECSFTLFLHVAW